jgi:integrase
MLNCGLRREEAIKLRIEQINQADRMIELGTDTKTHTTRKVPISEELFKHILSIIGRRKEGCLFMHRSKGTSERQYTKEQVNNIVANVGREAGIKPKGGAVDSDGTVVVGMQNVNPHLLRHTWAKMCQLAGIDKNYVRVMGGWKNMKMLDLIYGTPDYGSVKIDVTKKMNW